MKKQLLIILFCISLLLTGCSSLTISSGDTDLNPKKIHINFQAFAKTNTNEINTTIINPIDLNNFTNEELVNLKQIISTIYDSLGNYDYVMKMIDNPSGYYENLSEYFDSKFYDKLKSRNNDYIQETMTNIYKQSNCGYFKTNLIEINKEKNQEFKAVIQVLAIKDNQTLYGETNVLTFTNDYKITNIEKKSDLVQLEKSASPLTENNITDANTKFQEKLKNLLTSISNKYIYENYHALEKNTIEYKTKEEKEEKTKEINLQIETLLSKDNLDLETLKKLFLIGKGEFDNYEIVSYRIKNENNNEESIYKVGFVHDKDITYFDFTYNRALNEIIKIEEK